MLQQDYIMRLIREFFAALQRALEKNELEDRTKALHELYEQYVGPYEFYQAATIEQVMEKIEEYPEEQRIHRMEMLAELYYVEAGMRSAPVAEQLYMQAYLLFRFIDTHSGLYSLERRKKIEEIEQKLKMGNSLNPSMKKEN